MYLLKAYRAHFYFKYIYSFEHLFTEIQNKKILEITIEFADENKSEEYFQIA